MATLDDKLMGEKLHYYCSSSEDEGDGGDAHRVFPSCLGVAAGPQAPIHTELVNRDFKKHKL